MLVSVAVVVACILLFVSSGPNGAAGFGWVALPVLGLLSAGLWVGVLVHSIERRQLPPGLVVAPLIGIITIGLVYSATVSRARFVLLDRPAFEAVVAQVPVPDVNLPDRDLTADEAEKTYVDFPGPCPPTIGTLVIVDCATFAAGYLFYDEEGSGILDDGGIAYLPGGSPSHDVGNGGFESPTFVHLSGPWYSFASSW